MTGAQLFELLRQFLLGGVGTLCFGMLFGIPRPCYLACAATGAVGWLTYELAAATVEHAREQGATVLEGYPMEPAPGKKVIWDEASVGLLPVFLEAGFEVVASPTLRRRVVRHHLGADPVATGS